MLEFLGMVTDRGLIPLGALLLALLLTANELGYRFGRWRASIAPDPAETNIGLLTTGMVGLLAFTLGMTISIAEQRFEARRDQVMTEANAIGTAWLRAGLVKGEAGPEMRRQIEDYARLRLDYAQAGFDPPREAAMNATTNTQQTAIWRLAQTAAERDPTPIMASVIAALNEMFDATLAQRYAFESRTPVHIVLLLLVGSLMTVCALGVQLGYGPHRYLMLSVLLMGMWTGGMLLIVDLNRPREGNIRAETAPLVWTLQGFGSTAPAKK
jgi:hypothetical protein